MSNHRIDIHIIKGGYIPACFECGARSIENSTHGWVVIIIAMGAIFYGTGPAFKSGWNISTFNNVDIYPMIAHILGIKPVKMDGKLEDVMPLLK